MIKDNAPSKVIGPNVNNNDLMSAVQADSVTEITTTTVIDTTNKNSGASQGVRLGMHPDHDIMADYNGFLEKRNEGKPLERDTMMS